MKLETLESLAKAATPGPWKIDRDWLSAVLRHARKNPDYYPDVDYGNGYCSLDEDDVDSIIDALNHAAASEYKTTVGKIAKYYQILEEVSK